MRANDFSKMKRGGGLPEHIVDAGTDTKVTAMVPGTQ